LKTGKGTELPLRYALSAGNVVFLYDVIKWYSDGTNGHYCTSMLITGGVSCEVKNPIVDVVSNCVVLFDNWYMVFRLPLLLVDLLPLSHSHH
jgi:hypothetical protein